MKNLVFKALLFIFCLVVITQSYAEAAMDNPARTIKEVNSAEGHADQAQRVTTAKVVLADYELIKRDFRHLKDKTNVEIDNWLIKKAGLISVTQAAQSVVNTPIQVEGEYVSAYRPKDYGRALVFYADGGLLDVKGVGSLLPGQRDHGNGLATLGEGIREYIFEKLV